MAEVSDISDSVTNLTKFDVREQVLNGVLRICANQKCGRSKVWSCFGEIRGTNNCLIRGYVGCRFCKSVYSNKGGQTSGLLRHSCLIKLMAEEQSNYPQSRNQIVSLGASSSQTRTSAEQPNESTVDQPSSRNQQENSYIKENLAKERREISSRVNKLPQNISYIPKQTIPVVDDEMKDFVKSYGMAISKGLEALPADVAIEFSLKVLKEINEKVLEAKFEQKSYYGKENGYDWCSVSDENEYDEPDTLDSDAEMGGGQGVTSMRNEKPNKVPAVQEPSREETNTASLTVETDGIHAPVSTQAPINRSINERRKSILKRKKPSKDQPHTSTEKDRDVVRSVDDEMQNFVKSYGLTISRGLETLPGDVTIGVAINVLKELNQKVLETKFKRKRSDDNKSIHSWRSVSDENDGPDDSDTEMDDCDQEEVLPKENGNKDLFLDMPIKIEPEVM